MKIREATALDKDQIVEVLIASLGTTDLPITKEIWNYKHENNPFGKSLVLLAEENGKIMGVRAFMCWRWQENEQVFKAYRAVDTATHPEHQGKGIFKKLTLSALELAQKNNDNFIFNTPNDQSRPGYLKMGWEVVDKLNVGLKPAFTSFWKLYDVNISYNLNISSSNETIEELCENWNEKYRQIGKFFTPKNREFLNWRYENNPLQKYEVHSSNGIYLALYVKKRGRLKELRVAECLYDDNPEIFKKVKALISTFSKKFGVQLISYSPQLMDLGSFSVTGNFGPILTLRELNLNKEEKDEMLNVNNWNYSIGDLELF
jgi:GNAT superfamily N-acetyltransferase